jgi:hypothetical protein
MWIGQAQVGLEYARSFHGRSAPEFFVRGLFETQSWSSSDYDLTIEGVTSEASLQDTFSGFTFGVGWRR